MSTTAVLIRLQKIGADNFAVLFRNENFALGQVPVRERALFVHVAGKSVSFAGADDGLHDGPDRVRVCAGCRTDLHPRILARTLLNADGPQSDRGPRFTILN